MWKIVVAYERALGLIKVDEECEKMQKLNNVVSGKDKN